MAPIVAVPIALRSTSPASPLDPAATENRAPFATDKLLAASILIEPPSEPAPAPAAASKAVLATDISPAAILIAPAASATVPLATIWPAMAASPAAEIEIRADAPDAEGALRAAFAMILPEAPNVKPALAEMDTAPPRWALPPATNRP